MQRIRVCALVVGLLGCSQLAMPQPRGTIRLSVHSEGRPVSRARIAFLIGGDRTDFPPTNPGGNSSATVSAASIVDEYIEVWVEQCGRQSPQVYLLARGARLPRERTGCTRHKTGFFVPRGDGPWQVTTDVALLTVTTAGPVPALPPSSPDEAVTEERHVWFQGTFGAGINLIPSADNSCAAIIAIEPGADCSVEDRSFAFLANGSANISIIGAEGGFWRASPNQLTSQASLGGSRTTLVSTFQPRGFYAAGTVRLPALGRVSIVPKAGVTFWHVDLAQRQTLESDGNTTTTTTSSTVTGTSPFFGGAVETMLSKHLGVGVDYFYLRLRNDPVVHQHNHLAFAHVVVRFGRNAPP